MFVIVAYDVNVTSENGTARLRKVAKECVNYRTSHLTRGAWIEITV